VSSATFFWRSYRHRCTPSDPILTRDGGNTCRPRDLIMRCLIPPGRWYRFYPETTQIPSLSTALSTPGLVVVEIGFSCISTGTCVHPVYILTQDHDKPA